MPPPSRRRDEDDDEDDDDEDEDPNQPQNFFAGGERRWVLHDCDSFSCSQLMPDIVSGLSVENPNHHARRGGGGAGPGGLVKDILRKASQ